MNKETYSILIAEDHPMISEGIRTIASQLEDTECTVPKTTDHLVEILETKTFDLYIIDLGLQEINGFQIMEKLCKQHPTGKILVYTMHQEP